ncbi:MAG: N-acetylglucosamine kinase [Cytophagales bacterium]|nr:N-acetylglucosamine kinase [Bernardetiaceae bacterium]MDW8203452.1 N-acetylglucosamine kinase [Cytophagales bacterium]
MILIADSGATKTAWRLILPQQHALQARTAGINPYFSSPQAIASELTDVLLPQLQAAGALQVAEQVRQVFFYGTGCGAEENRQLVAKVLQKVFPAAAVHVDTDMLGAARALCGKQPGIACILGTGSHAALFNGEQIEQYAVNLGFWLGDEGSGGHLGKQLITDYLNGDLPKDLHDFFAKRYAITREEVLENAYKKPMPARYMASFSKFLFDHLSHPFVYRMVYNSFCAFLDKRVLKFPDAKKLPLHFTGSVAFYYANVLRRAAADKGLHIQHILEEPVAGLVLYHGTC